MVRLAIVGIGGYGWQLAQEILRASDAMSSRLVGAADASFAAWPERAEALGAAEAELFDDALVEPGA